MRTSYFLLLESCDASMTINNVITFIVMKEWPLFKPCHLKRSINYLCFTKSSFWKFEVGWCGTNGILGKSNRIDDEEPATRPAISPYVLQCVTDFHISIFLEATAQKWYGQNHTGCTARSGLVVPTFH